MANPLYFRSSNPGLGNVAAKANKLFEWDGTGSMPAELVAGKGVMPPQATEGETVIWADSFTLGYTDEANAAPVFFSDGGAGDVKVLEMINHIAGRLDQALFSDLAAAKAWISATNGVYFDEGTGAVPAGLQWNLNTTTNGSGQHIYTNGYTVFDTNPETWTPSQNFFRFATTALDGTYNLTAFQNLSNGYIKVAIDASNYAIYQVTYTSTNNYVYNNGTGETVNLTINSVVETVGSRPAQGNGSVNPVYATITMGATLAALTGGGSGSPSVINLAQGGATQHDLSIINDTNQTINRLNIGSGEYYAAGYGIGFGTEVAWLPLAPGQSLEFSGVNSFYGAGGSGSGTTLQIGMGVHWSTSATRRGFASVNGVAGNPDNFNADSTTNYFNIARAGYISLQAGDSIVLSFENLGVL